MKILITGAKGFVVKNLVASLEAIRDGKDRVHKIQGLENPEDLVLYTYDIDSKPEELEDYCKDADFVFNLAGVNRPKNQEEFKIGRASCRERVEMAVVGGALQQKVCKHKCE